MADPGLLPRARRPRHFHDVRQLLRFRGRAGHAGRECQVLTQRIRADWDKGVASPTRLRIWLVQWCILALRLRGASLRGFGSMGQVVLQLAEGKRPMVAMLMRMGDQVRARRGDSRKQFQLRYTKCSRQFACVVFLPRAQRG